MAWFRRAFKRSNDGTIEVRLGSQERDLLRAWVTELRELLGDDEHRPALRRLSPPAYSEDVVRDAEYQAFMGSELQRSRQAALDRLLATAEADRLTESEAIAWLQAVNAVRLVLGTHLGVTEDEAMPTSSDEDAGLHAAYQVLSLLLEELVGALSAGA